MEKQITLNYEEYLSMQEYIKTLESNDDVIIMERGSYYHPVFIKGKDKVAKFCNNLIEEQKETIDRLRRDVSKLQEENRKLHKEVQRKWLFG